ncbi:MAG: type IV toxin-antitoxin system AbiEi family antitoxin [Steroidobacteraceae bacterium]
MSEKTKGPTRGRVARFLDDLQARGDLVVSVDEAAKQNLLTRIAAQRQLERLAPRATRLPGRPSAFLIVPPEHRLRGAPPVTAWLHEYFRAQGDPYYVGLLSAAALHGSSNQAVQVTQVLLRRPRRPITVGKIHLDFYVKSRLELTPLTEIPGLPAPLAVSSPEATALDLIAFSHRLGGIERAIDVIKGLKGAMTATGMRSAIRAGVPVTVLQRIGYVFEMLRFDSLADVVQRTLPKRFPPARLQAHGQSAEGPAREPWAIVDNIQLRRRRT